MIHHVVSYPHHRGTFRRTHFDGSLHQPTVTTVGFIIAGFGIMFSEGNALVGNEWFFLQGMSDAMPRMIIPILAYFLFQFAFSAAASMIASGLRAERADYRADLVYSFFSGLLMYPIFGYWVWSGGWLADLSYVDFTGSSVAHMVGAFPVACVLFRLIKSTLGLRVSAEVEESGLDLPLYGVGWYAKFVE